MTSGSKENQVEQEEVEFKIEKNQVKNECDTKTEEQQTKKNDHEIEQDLQVYNKETFKKFLIWWIVKNNLPFTCVKSEDLCNMIYLLRKDVFIPSTDTIKNYIMTFFEDSQKKIASILKNISSKISFTIDAWTSLNNNSFLGITAHWITENWELKSFLLDFIKLKEPHSDTNIKEAFLKSLKNFNIESKILGITTDNASNNITFLKAVETDLSQRYIYFNSDNKHVQYLAHVINLVAQQVFTTLKAIQNDDESLDEEVGSLIHKLRILIKKIKASSQQEEKFRVQCKVANVPNLNVVLDVCTRWNFTYAMLIRARKLKECFVKATKQICRETYLTLSYVIPIYNILLNKLEDFCDTPDQFENGKEAAINAINKLKNYYNKTDSTLYAVSLILDLRLKVSELYKILYAPQETQNTNIEYNSSDKDLVSHIFKQHRIESISKFDHYLKADRA
ncbi:hypothetical protein RclHR1_05900014 [Rhizophagus clarus]|uniref:hAT-like transposase RNase-H fold domain-containing protein n=1 Tax=Rhizophagus clarus TaxID=94130 RepID=A0A2Z6SGU4_9GLOM|nr:hypothetical protein RclHR1_05900014 [Rhizophagus clarus]